MPRAAASRVNAVEMWPELGSPGKSAVMRHTLRGFSSGRSCPSWSRMGFCSAAGVAGAAAACLGPGAAPGESLRPELGCCGADSAATAEFPEPTFWAPHCVSWALSAAR